MKNKLISDYYHKVKNANKEAPKKENMMNNQTKRI